MTLKQTSVPANTKKQLNHASKVSGNTTVPCLLNSVYFWRTTLLCVKPSSIYSSSFTLVVCHNTRIEKGRCYTCLHHMSVCVANALDTQSPVRKYSARCLVLFSVLSINYCYQSNSVICYKIHQGISDFSASASEEFWL